MRCLFIILSICLITFSTLLVVVAQGRKGNIKSTTIATPTAQCKACKLQLERYIGREPGIIKVHVNIKRKVITVKYDSNRTNISNIKTAITNAGYDADELKANPDSYNRLPPCCKRP